MGSGAEQNPRSKDNRDYRVVAVLDCRVHNQRSILSWLEGNRPPDWKLIVTGWMPLNPWLSLGNLQLDGILTEIPLKQRGLPPAVFKIPIVGVSWEAVRDQLYPCVVPDCDLAAARVVKHFTEIGIGSFAFVGNSGSALSAEWARSFREAVSASGGNLFFRNETFPEVPEEAGSRMQRLIQWLQRLPKPVGILAWNAVTSRILLDACVRAEVHVPEEVALVSAEENPLFCETTDIPISAVSLDTEQTALRSRDILTSLLNGEFRRDPQIVKIPPKGLIARKSSSLRSVNWLISRAYDCIGKNIHKPLHVDTVAAKLGVSRRSLERAFKEHVGRTPYAEIVRSRLERSKKLLLSTDFSMEQIAQECGFPSSKQLFVSFKKTFGCAPITFRQSGSNS